MKNVWLCIFEFRLYGCRDWVCIRLGWSNAFIFIQNTPMLASRLWDLWVLWNSWIFQPDWCFVCTGRSWGTGNLNCTPLRVLERRLYFWIRLVACVLVWRLTVVCLLHHICWATHFLGNIVCFVLTLEVVMSGALVILIHRIEIMYAFQANNIRMSHLTMGCNQ